MLTTTQITRNSIANLTIKSSFHVKYTLCNAAEIEDPGSRAFEIPFFNKRVDVFVVHSGGCFHAYVNSCPHTGITLEWLEHQFLDLDKTFIQCSSHDALFEIDTGRCIAGPCVGKSLQPLELSQEGSALVIHVPDDFVNLNTSSAG